MDNNLSSISTFRQSITLSRKISITVMLGFGVVKCFITEEMFSSKLSVYKCRNAAPVYMNCVLNNQWFNAVVHSSGLLNVQMSCKCEIA